MTQTLSAPLPLASSVSLCYGNVVILEREPLYASVRAQLVTFGMVGTSSYKHIIAASLPASKSIHLYIFLNLNFPFTLPVSQFFLQNFYSHLLHPPPPSTVTSVNMPELGEVARIVSRLHSHLVGKTISSVNAVDDALVFKDTTAAEFTKVMKGKRVVDAKQWGKYFWLEMDQPPHPVMHCGMTGWIHIKNDPAAHYRSDTVSTEWPPKFLKFSLSVKEDDNEFAFVDARRLGRVRLITPKEGFDIRHSEPIAANGPDPAQEDISLEWFSSKLRRKAVPVKGFLLDQAMLSGIGNWVGDEILYEAKIHPEAYTNTLSDEQIEMLLNSVKNVTRIAVDTLAEQERFPKCWLMLHRWNKGKNGGGMLPSGEKIEFVNVGGRTSAFVRAVQKMGQNKRMANAGEETKKGGKGKKAAKEEEEEGEEGEEEEKPNKAVRGKKAKEEVAESKETAAPAASRKRKTAAASGKDAAAPQQKKGKAGTDKESSTRVSPPPRPGRPRAARTRK
ncbi:Formamidopyrimidine-DNA glycosylase N-terminal domain-containing protein [Kalaharituber pfeilii]|nr:Formamidopyrimidine-DNA glycosylase N-terminal domain-containing protein [Kalaharituber pfeilii]